MREIDWLYAIVQTSKLSTGVQALSLLYQLHYSSEGVPDRFYSSLYRRLETLDPASADSQLFDLLYKVLKNDSEESRVRAFIKRLLQVSPGFLIGPHWAH